MTVGLGEPVLGIDIVAQRARMYNVSGVLRTAGPQPEFASMSLVPSGESLPALVVGSGVLGRSGKFAFHGVAAGDYDLYFIAGLEQGISAGRRAIRVADRDVVGVEIDAQPPVTIIGRVRVENGDMDGLSEGRIGLRSADLVIGPSYSAIIKDYAGSFELTDCSPGRYMVDVMPPSGHYLKQMRYGGIEVADFQINVTGQDAELELVFRRGATRLRGRWSSNSGEGATPSGGDRAKLGAYYMIAPQLQASPLLDVRFGPFDPDGGFDLQGLAPGRYRVIAQISPDPNVLRNPTALSALGNTGVEITLAEGEVADVVVPLTNNVERE